ncbi:MAG: hypothetical protein QXJ74_07755 [Nitrososphaera sp.]|uniref:hypothetical protein n=1 Tax=Nitrososphaera sp. TaxID=1971748 RepID=UPI0017D0CF53|nr:hypothetical protein [Nitrososphaera sp.]NWG38093.1 hypothetical protein [Nitrososphaera sp.]
MDSKKVTEKIFKNTFAPHVKNDTMPVGAIIALLRVGGLRYNILPEEVKKAVSEEMDRREMILKSGKKISDQ